MSYEAALKKAWEKIADLADKKRLSVKFLTDEYDIDLEGKKVLSVSCNAPAKDHTSIILLHYVIKCFDLGVLPQPTGRWIDFRELEGGIAYYPTFKKRTIGVVLRKYGSFPETLLDLVERLKAKKAKVGDTGIIIEPLKDVPILITMSKADEEFGPDANIVFDETIPQIFCTEDVVVLTEILAHAL